MQGRRHLRQLSQGNQALDESSQALSPGFFHFRFRQRKAREAEALFVVAHRLRRSLGDQAENWVAEWLVGHGLVVLERNVRLGYLEIDIVAREGAVLAIVEVRRRGPSAFTTGFSSLSAKKRRRIRWAGERLWNRKYKYDRSIERLRFDVASVSFEGLSPRIEYVRAAF